MSVTKLSPECEKCAYVRWCPNKRSGEEFADFDSAVRADNVDHYRADLDGLIENLQEELARYYGVPKCFFEKKQ